MVELHDLTLAEASTAIAKRKLSPVEYLDALRARSEALEPRLNTTVLPLWDAAREEAKKAARRIARSGPRSPIDGLPIGLQVVAPWLGEPTIIRIAAAFEAARPWAGTRPGFRS